jgi:SAM-dependent methyltransferase
MNKNSEFDQFAGNYDQTLCDALNAYGLAGNDFFKRRIEEITYFFHTNGLKAPERILDFGCGTGGHLKPLAQAFPNAQIVGIDTSEASIDLAKKACEGIAKAVKYDGHELPSAIANLDLVVFANVFHHIDRSDHQRVLLMLRKAMNSDGIIAMFEHNPINPVTRKFVRDCPLDVGVKLLWPRYSKKLFSGAKLFSVQFRFVIFFPPKNTWLRKFERYLFWLPIGAQYVVFGRVK